MKLCIYCESDLVEKKNFYYFTIPAAVFIALMPYGGIFLCWLPLLITGNYSCKNCGREFNKPKELDWREFEAMKKENDSK